jgi:glucosamine--fructose-6-phosphate aminotransferase (isomerizing)
VCGIIGYIGGSNSIPLLIEGLKRLEYRGYDSAGIAVVDRDELRVYKREGKISNLEQLIEETQEEGLSVCNAGVGHTRWATHGKPTSANAHPHTSGSIAVVHNGVIENYQVLKEELIKKGYVFQSDTDTEVIAHLLHYHSQDKELTGALRAVLSQLRGSYALGVLCSDCPDIILAARRDSPLVVGVGEGENFIASDIPAFLPHTNRVMYISDGEIVKLTRNSVEVFNEQGEAVEKPIRTIEWDVETAEKSGYEHFMLKEIYEQPKTVHETLAGRVSENDAKVCLEGLDLSKEYIQSLQRIVITACGTSYNAAMLGKYLFERTARIHTDIEIASELRYATPLLDNVFFITISQSGETADTLAAMRLARSYNCKTLTITNVAGSSITRESEHVLYTRCGPEIGVAATKTFTSQVVILYLLAIYFARIRNQMTVEEAKRLLVGLRQIPSRIRRLLSDTHSIEEYAEQLKGAENCYFVGRNLQYPVALEGALKMKEISYIHAEGYPAGELKHGPLALITENTPVVAIVNNEETYEKTISNIKEMNARGAEIIAVADEGDTEIEKFANSAIYVPKVDSLLSPILSTVALQLLAYYTAKARNCSIDMPRNLAKSVTVE